MKLPCPYCTENIVYDHSLAGKTIKCSYCQKNIFMTPFDKLPPDYQQEYKDELEKIRKKQEAAERKLEEIRNKQLKRQEAEQRKLEEQKHKELEFQKLHDNIYESARVVEIKTDEQIMMQEEWDAEISEAKKRIPEDDLISGSYPILKNIYAIYQILAVITALAGVILLLAGLFGDWSSLQYKDQLRGPCIIGAIWLLSMFIFFLTSSEIIQLGVNMANDIRVSKALLKRIAYYNNKSNPPPISQNQTLVQ